MPLDTDSAIDPKEHRRKQIREAKARHDARLKEMTRLEQAAFQERKTLGEEFNPYTGIERAEMEAIRKLQAELQERAQTLNNTILHRLKREAGQSEGWEMLLARFRTQQPTRIEVPPF